MTTIPTIAGAALLAAVSAAGPARAQQAEDWPCVQRLVPSLEAGQMWAGPAAIMPTTPDPALEALAQRLADARQPPEALTADVRAFADGLPAERRAERLAQLFAVALDKLNGERAVLLGGIKRYARGQQRMAEKISAETRTLDKLRQEPGAPAAQVAELQAARDWDIRVFTDRQRSLQLVCEQPVLLEQRAFALARIIQDRLP